MGKKSTSLNPQKRKLLTSPEQPDLYADLGYELHRQVNYAGATRAYRLGLQLAPRSSILNCKLGLTQHNLGNHKEAIFYYNIATECDRSNAEAHYYLGFILIQEGRCQEAVKWLSRSLELNPDLQPAYHYLGVAWERLGQPNKARDLLLNQFKISYPRFSSDVLFTLGDILSGNRGHASSTCHTHACLGALLETIARKHIHCFGDSHRSVFNNLDQVTCHNTGAGTAYNLISARSSTGAGGKILKVVSKLDPESDALLLAFGEIDCMEHLYKNSFRSGKNPNELIKELTSRFIAFAKTLTDQGFYVLIYGPAFSGLALNSHGTIEDRNLLALLFNQALEEAAKLNSDIGFASLIDILLKPGFRPRLHLSNDGRHLDSFPEGSKIFQGILLSRFLSFIKKHQTKAQHRPGFIKQNQSYNVGKPFIVIRKSSHSLENTPESPPIQELTTGLLSNDLEIELQANSRSETTVVIDLQDHVPVESISCIIQPASGASVATTGYIEVVGIRQDSTENLIKKTVNPAIIHRLNIEITPSVTRGIALKLQLQPCASSGHTIQLRLSQLRISGDCYGTAWETEA